MALYANQTLQYGGTIRIPFSIAPYQCLTGSVLADMSKTSIWPYTYVGNNDQTVKQSNSVGPFNLLHYGPLSRTDYLNGPLITSGSYSIARNQTWIPGIFSSFSKLAGYPQPISLNQPGGYGKNFDSGIVSVSGTNNQYINYGLPWLDPASPFTTSNDVGWTTILFRDALGGISQGFVYSYRTALQNSPYAEVIVPVIPLLSGMPATIVQRINTGVVDPYDDTDIASAAMSAIPNYPYNLMHIYNVAFTKLHLVERWYQPLNQRITNRRAIIVGFSDPGLDSYNFIGWLNNDSQPQPTVLGYLFSMQGVTPSVPYTKYATKVIVLIPPSLDRYYLIQLVGQNSAAQARLNILNINSDIHVDPFGTWYLTNKQNNDMLTSFGANITLPIPTVPPIPLVCSGGCNGIPMNVGAL